MAPIHGGDMSLRRPTVMLCLVAIVAAATACSPGARYGPTNTRVAAGPPSARPTPTWKVLSEAYFVAADRAGRDFNNLYVQQRQFADTVQAQHLWCDSLAAIDTEFTERVEKIPWTDDYRTEADAVLEKTAAVLALLDKCTKAKSLKTIHALQAKVEEAYTERRKASERLRKDLHLSTIPLR
jgi:hypothetical protein